MSEDISGYRSANGNWYNWIDWAAKHDINSPYYQATVDEELKKLCDKGDWDGARRHVGAAKKKTFAFTFTTNLDTKLEVQKEMCSAAWKLFQQKTTPVSQGQVYLEYTEQGRPHLHGWYETEDGGRIFAKTFRRCWPPWGEKARQTRFAGGFHELMKTNRYIGYSSSEGRLVVSKQPNADVFYHVETAEKWDI